jgi:DNA-binding NarL/FixJ family response regulator
MGQRIRMLIADDHPHSRKGLRALLSTCPVLEVIGEAQDGREAVQLVEECQPDVVLMDIQMPIWDGLQATRVIKTHWPEVRVIILTIRTAGRAAAISAGADGFLLKGCSSEALFAEIQGHRDTDQESGSAESWPQSGMPIASGGIGQRDSLKIALSTSWSPGRV